VRVRWNRKTLEIKPPQMGAWVEYSIPAGWVESQNNTLELSMSPEGERQVALADLCIALGRSGTSKGGE